MNGEWPDIGFCGCYDEDEVSSVVCRVHWWAAVENGWMGCEDCCIAILTSDWVRAEREAAASADIAAGRTTLHKSDEDFLAALGAE